MDNETWHDCDIFPVREGAAYLWTWRSACGRPRESKELFARYEDCVADARAHGFNHLYPLPVPPRPQRRAAGRSMSSRPLRDMLRAGGRFLAEDDAACDAGFALAAGILAIAVLAGGPPAVEYP